MNADALDDSFGDTSTGRLQAGVEMLERWDGFVQKYATHASSPIRDIARGLG